jgi:hypothetical protein
MGWRRSSAVCGIKTSVRPFFRCAHPDLKAWAGRGEKMLARRSSLLPQAGAEPKAERHKTHLSPRYVTVPFVVAKREGKWPPNTLLGYECLTEIVRSYESTTLSTRLRLCWRRTVVACTGSRGSELRPPGAVRVQVHGGNPIRFDTGLCLATAKRVVLGGLY